MLPGNHRASDALATRRDIQCERERENRTLGQTRRDETNLCLPRRSLGEGGTSDISLLPPTDMPALIVLSEAPLGLPVSHWL